MNSISIASALHKAQIQTANPWHILLTIYPDPAGHPETVLRLAHENQDVTYKGDQYIAFNFDFDPVQDKSTGQLASISMRVCNINRAIHYYLEQYDGGIGAKVELRVVSSEAMSDDPSVFMEFEITEASADSEWATFTLGADNPMRKSFPKFIYLKDFCMWKYNAPELQSIVTDGTLEMDANIADETAHNTSANAAYNATNFPGNFTGTTTTDTAGTTLAVDSSKSDDGFNPSTPAHVSDVSVKTLCPNFAGKWFAHLNPWFRAGGGGGHVDIGVNSNSTAWVQAGMDDIHRRGFDGVIIDWYGPTTGSNPYVDNVTLKIKARLAVSQNLTYSIQIDAQSYANTSELQAHLAYIKTTYLSDPNYQKVNGKPIISFFSTVGGVDYAAAKASMSIPVYFMFENASSLANAYADAAFDWIHAYTDGPHPADPYFLAAVSNFLATVHSNAKGTMPCIHPGFNGFLTGSTAWARGKYIPRDGGKCWLSIAATINANIPTNCIGIQVATWCDWEEGSEIEAGIENAVSISASVSGGILSFAASGGTGDESTISEFRVLASKDGAAAATIASIPPSSGTHALNLNEIVGWGLGQTYSIYVQAIGKASIRNKISSPASFTSLSATSLDTNSTGGAQCGYEGSLPTCSKTLGGDNGCRAHNNSARFGGFPFIDSTGFRAASIV